MRTGIRAAASVWVLLVAACLAACGPAATSSGPAAVTPADGNPLAGTEWTLVSLQGQDLLEGTHISLAFGTGKGTGEAISGFAGCNGYWGGPDGGGYVAGDDGSLEIPGIAITVELCPSPEGVMDQEQAYIAALQSAAAYRLAGDRLEIQDASGQTVLLFVRFEEQAMDPAALLGTVWQLVSMDGQPMAEGSNFTLGFRDEHRAAGHAGRRGYVAMYRAEDDDLTFGYTAMLGTIAPDDPLLEPEGTYTTMLGWTSHYRLGEGQLELLTRRGEVLAFEPLPEAAQAALEGPDWLLLSFVEPKPVEDSPVPLPLPLDVLEGTEITARFEEGLVRGSAGCNSYQGAYTRSGDALSFEGVAMTEMACLDPEGAMEQEQRFWTVLGDVTTHWLLGGQLWLEAEDGRALVFSRDAGLSTSLPAPLPAPQSFRSDRYHLEASLPQGWAAAEGPEPLARPFTGLVSFDNWGASGFWAPEVRTEDSATYSPQSTLGQVPTGGAYVVLVHSSGGPPMPAEEYGPEYTQEDLSGLWQPKDCREAGGATWIDFFKWGRRLRLEVYCHPDASDATASQANDLLASWRFDRVPAGDVGWATVLARSSLPPAAHPAKFPLLSAWQADEGPLQSSSADLDATRITQAEVRGQVLQVTFTLRWGDPPAGWSGDDCPLERCHWWRFEVWADGQLVIVGEGGAPLLTYSLEGAWRQYSDATLGFAVQVPADWEVLAMPYHDILGRSWKAVEFVSPDYALDYPPLDQYHFTVAVAPGPGGTLTETVELSLSPVAPDVRNQIRVQCCLPVGGEPAMELLDYPLTRWGNRQLVVLHQGWEYRLIFYPERGISADNEVGAAARRVVDAFLRTFAFLPITSTPPLPTPTITPAPTPSPPSAGPAVPGAGAS